MPKHKRPTEKNPVVTPKQERSKATFEAMVTATAYLLAERGYNSFSTNDIAERAGVNINSFYQYFLNREAAVLECARRILEEDETAFFECLDRAEELPDPRAFEWIVEEMLQYFSNQSKLKREVFFHLPSIIGTEEKQLRRKLFADRLLKFLPQAMAATVHERKLASFVIVQSFLGSHVALWEPEMPKRQQTLVQAEIKKLILSYVGLYRSGSR